MDKGQWRGQQEVVRTNINCRLLIIDIGASVDADWFGVDVRSLE